MSFWSFLSIAIGASLTLGGALAAARGLDILARWLKLSPAIRGAIAVGLAVSLPELAIVRWAASDDVDLPELALGSLVGGVTANYLFALALGALALPIVVPRRLLLVVYPLAIASAIGALALAWMGEISARMGTLLLTLGLVWPFVALVIGRTRRREADERSHRTRSTKPIPEISSNERSLRSLLAASIWVFAGAAAVYYGPRFLIEPAMSLADATDLGASTLGLVFLALLATLPETILCLVLAKRGDREMGVAIVVGSGLFNWTLGLGLLSALSPNGLTVPSIVFEFALPVAIAATLVCVPCFYGLARVGRASALAFFAVYVGFVVWLLVGENAQSDLSVDDRQTPRFYAMFALSLGLILATSIIAVVGRLIEKARLADE